MTIGATTRRSATALASDADVTTLSAVVPRGDLTIPVDEPLGSMLPDGGLQRGSIVGCEGPAAVSLAAAMVAGAARAGSWVLLLGIPMVGLEAFDELGVSLRRVVSVEAGVGPAGWAERLAAAADGFELILSHPPRGADRVERKIRQRLRARGAVLLSVGVAGHAVGCDLTFSTTSPRWVGIGQGHGRLAAREVEVRLAGRRIPRPIDRTVLLPGPDGRLHAAQGRPLADGAVPASAVPAGAPLLERVG